MQLDNNTTHPTRFKNIFCHAPFHEVCPKDHGHKGDPRWTPGTSGTIGEKAQVMIVVRALGV